MSTVHLQPVTDLMLTLLLYCLYSFWATVCKTVRPILLDRCLSVLSVYDVGVLWPNGWMEKMPLGKEVGLGPGHIVLDRDQLPQKGHSPPTQFSAHVCCSQTVAHLSYC